MMNKRGESITVPGNLFDWKKGIGITESSTLGIDVGGRPECVAVKSHRTGAVRNYFFSHTTFTADSSAMYTYSDVERNSIVIFND